MSWLKKSVKKLAKSTTKIVKKAVKNPLAIVAPVTYFSNASAAAPVAAAAGKSGSELGDEAGTIAAGATIGGGVVLGGAAVAAPALSTAAASAGATVGTVAGTGGVAAAAGELDIKGGLKKLFKSRLGELVGGRDEASPALEPYEPAAPDAGGQLDTNQLLTYAGFGLAALVAVLLVSKVSR